MKLLILSVYLRFYSVFSVSPCLKYFLKNNLRFFIDFVWIKERLGMFNPLAVFPFDIKTAAVAGVAGGYAVLLYLDDDRIGITVGQHFHNLLSIARLFALHPILVAGTAEEPGLAVLQR